MTIRDLARLADVSHSTVSRALQNSPRLPLKTRERIQRLAKEHGYRPHPLVSKLMAQLPHIKTVSRSTIALVTSFPRSDRSFFIEQLYAGIEERAEALGYLLEEFAMADHHMSCRQLSDVLYTRGIQGVIIFPFRKSPSHLSLIWERFSSIAIGRTLARPLLHRVSFSQFENAALALRRMHKLGYTRIGLAMAEGLLSRGGDTYLAAYGLYQRNLPPDDRLPVLIRPKMDAREVVEWLRSQRADAILCNCDPPPSLLRAGGFDIPGQLGYAALDRASCSGDTTGIEQHPRYVGAAAVDMLTAHLNRNERGIPPFAKTMAIQGEWIQGQTVRRLAAR